MHFLLSSLIEVFTDITRGIMGFFVKDFWNELSIADVTVSDGKGVFKTHMMFDDYLPGAGGEDIRLIFKIIGITIVLLLIFMNLAKAFLPQEASQSIQHPFETIARGAGACFAVFNAYLIMVIIQKPMAIIFSEIYKIASKADNMQPDFTANSPSTQGVLIPFDASLSEMTIAPIAAAVISLFIFIAITWAFIQLIAEVIERYVIMCFLFYVAPIPFSSFASNTTHQIATSYLRMIFSQYLLMMFNLCFVYVFCYAFTNQNGGKPFTSPQEAIIFYLVLLSWLKLGRSLDEHMRTLGLSAAQTGRGIMAEAVVATSGLMMGLRTIKGGFDAMRSGFSMAKDSISSVPSAAANDISQRNFSENKAVGMSAINNLSPNMRSTLMNAGQNGLTQSDAKKIGSELTGIPQDMIAHSSIGKSFASEGAVFTDNNNSKVKIAPISNETNAALSAAGINPDGMHCTFTNPKDGNMFAMQPLDDKTAIGGLMASAYGADHISFANRFGADPLSIENGSSLCSVNATFDSEMAQKYGIDPGNYIVFDNKINVLEPGSPNAVYRQIDGRQVGFVSTENEIKPVVRMRGFLKKSEGSGAERLASKTNI